MRKFLISIIIVSAAANLLLTWQVWAGSPDSPGLPNATTSYTLEDIYQRLNTGAAGTQGIFTEPAVAPGTGTMHTLNDIMGLAPALDNTNGASQTHVLAGKTLWGLTGGQWGVITGTRPAAPVPLTGQTASYAVGDDGDLERGVAWPTPRFTDNGNGTVTDNLTGLIWLKNANCFGLRNWVTALTDANGLASSSCGLTDGSSAGDWRLPNVRELQSLIDYGRFNPALPAGHPFTNVQGPDYWSSSTYGLATTAAWAVNLDGGIVNGGDKTITLYVWPVRGGQ
jgi:hypothetical protein